MRWARCWAGRAGSGAVHLMRNLLALVPHGAREAVAAVVRTIFAQPDHASAMAQLEKVVDGLRPRFAQAAALLAEAAEDLLAHKHFPEEHRTRLHSTNPLERLNKEIKRRSNVVGIFPNSPALLRLVGAILMEQDDEWAVADRHYFSAESMRQLTRPLPRRRRRSCSRRLRKEEEEAWGLWETRGAVFQGVRRTPSASTPSTNGNSGAVRFTPLDGALPFGIRGLPQDRGPMTSSFCECGAGSRPLLAPGRWAQWTPRLGEQPLKAPTFSSSYHRPRPRSLAASSHADA